MLKRVQVARLFGVMFILLLCVLSACQLGENNDQARDGQEDNGQRPQKNVVMIMLDSMMGSAVDRGLEEGTLPALQFLIENGYYDKELVVPFPSMSVTIESTLLTGETPDTHRIPGLAWYDDNDDRIVNYGTTWNTWLKRDFSQGAKDVLFRLNNAHLNEEVTTIYEELSERGKTSGSVNMVVYRGDQTHTLSLPALTDEVTDVPQTIETKGPDILAFGRFAKPTGMDNTEFSDGVFNRLGLSDAYAAQVTEALIQNDQMPDFLLVFFPDNDEEVHENSPHYQKGLERADQHIQEILNGYTSWEDALKETVFIILGDHGQDKQFDDEETVAIDLLDLYADYEIPALADPVSSGEVAVAVNQRMTYVFDVQDCGLVPTLAEQSKKDDRIALAAWLDDDDWVQVRSTDHDGTLRFQSDSNGKWVDRYGGRWSIEGNMDIVALKADHTRSRIAYDTYPDVLLQLESALNTHDVPALVLTAKPGHAFRAEAGAIHPDGGEHGGIHKNDTLAAIIIAGTDERPASNRIIDLKQYVLRLLDE